jgi:phosphoribosylformylglycinamidine synthase subunit PurS
LKDFRLEVLVRPRPGLLDPQGKAVHHALNSLGWDGVEEVRIGKAILLDLKAASEAEALELAEAMCRKLLANPVTEDFEISAIAEAATAGEVGS